MSFEFAEKPSEYNPKWDRFAPDYEYNKMQALVTISRELTKIRKLLEKEASRG